MKSKNLLEPLKLYQEDISELALDIHNWLQYTPLASSEEGFDHLLELIEQRLDKFSHGFRNYN